MAPTGIQVVTIRVSVCYKVYFSVVKLLGLGLLIGIAIARPRKLTI